MVGLDLHVGQALKVTVGQRINIVLHVSYLYWLPVVKYLSMKDVVKKGPFG